MIAQNKKNEKIALQHRLIMMLSSFKYSFDIAKLKSRINEVDNEKAKLNQKIADIETKLSNTIEDYTKKKEKITKEVKLFEKRINNAEHDILSHVLSLMGIFTAIITIILSVIVTSSSWLNNADMSDAVIAFVVPNAIALCAVSLLLTLIFRQNRRRQIDTYGSKETPQDKESAKSVIVISIVAFVMTAMIICAVCLYLANQTPNPHVIYVLSPGEYRVAEKVVTPVPDDGSVEEEKRPYFEFTFEDKLYRFEYDESYLHDGNLYFCEKHCTLE